MAIRCHSPRNIKARGRGLQAGQLDVQSEQRFPVRQFADNANTVKESADGSTGRFPASCSGAHAWRMTLARRWQSEPGVRCEKHLRPGLLHPLYDDNNKGIYAGQPRTLYMQGR